MRIEGSMLVKQVNGLESGELKGESRRRSTITTTTTVPLCPIVIRGLSEAESQT